MTNEEINEAVARKLGWTHDHAGWWAPVLSKPRPYATTPLPSFCERIEAAWEIVEHLAKENEHKGCGPIIYLMHDGQWIFRIGEMGKTLSENQDSAVAATAPLAICGAFLKLTGDPM